MDEPHSGAERAAQGDDEVATDEAEAASTRRIHAGTKQTLIEMLRAKDGATIAEICDATGLQPHAVRGAFAEALKKRLGLEVTSEGVDGRGRAWRLPPVG